MDNKNKSLWDEMVSEVKKEFTPEEVKKMKKQKTKAAWWYQAGFYLLLAIAVAVGIIKCCIQIAIPLWCLWPKPFMYFLPDLRQKPYRHVMKRIRRRRQSLHFLV